MTQHAHRRGTHVQPRRGGLLLGLGGALLATSAGMFTAYAVTQGQPATAHAAVGPSARARPPGPHDGAVAGSAGPVDPSLAALLERAVTVSAAGQTVSLRWSELGAVVDEAEVGRAGADLAALEARGALPIRIDRARAVAALAALRGRVDRPPVDAFLDLEGRKVRPEAAGQGVDVLGSLARLALAARSAAATVELAVIPVPARVTRDSLGIDDISSVLGTHTTRFSVSDKERNFNLKLAASKVNGFVLKPGQEFSFNTVVGERSEKQGYKVAHVIQAGEMVDGLAGGTCQISTTLFAASFFAGLEVVRQTPHSRPSVYAPLGLDATVVWPTTDLKLSNSYDFPIAIHYRVAAGLATVEILGKARPYDKVVFSREVIEETPYNSEERQDERLALGSTSLDQPGFPGYKLTRYRKFIKDGKVVKTNRWVLQYKPVTEYIRIGTNPDPAAPQPKLIDHHMPKPPSSSNASMSQ
ncbi:MAG: VanW family protein [Kofleriaceae bacterium]|nr:VanW family protein [Kofleriaceae bacterium]